MAGLADSVLPLIRTRAQLYDWRAADEHGDAMHHGIDILELALPTADPAEAYAVTDKAVSSAITLIQRADDSNGSIGDACRRLLGLHPMLAAAAHASPARLVPWMITFQLDGGGNFELDPVAYAPALGEKGMQNYRARLEDVRQGLPPLPPGVDMWQGGNLHERWILDWNDRRLAVLDRNIDAIIRTHARDRRVAAFLEDTATALEEIGESELAIGWAKQATDFDRGHQSVHAAEYWCSLLEEHHPDQLLGARSYVFDRWPTAVNAAHLHSAAGTAWPQYDATVAQALTANPSDAVTFALNTLKDTRKAWQLAHELELTDDRTWDHLVKAYERIDAVAVLPIHRRLVEQTLVETGVRNYRDAARRLVRMRRLAAGTDHADDVDRFIGQLREDNRRRPRLRDEFDRAKLP